MSLEQVDQGLSQLSQVISHAVAPAFLLSAVAGFASLAIGRMEGVLGRIRAINGGAGTGHGEVSLRDDLPRLRTRAHLLHRSIYYSVGCGICITVLVIQAFLSALIGIRHEPGAALLFVVATALLGVSLSYLAREVRIALTEYDHYA